MANPPYPIVKVTTQDDLTLYGFLHRSKRVSNRIIVHIHGTSGNFYCNNFYPYIAEVANRHHYAYLQTNNRGANNFEYEPGQVPHGAALELFEDSLMDIDAWLKYCLDAGFDEIILEAHSFGNEKVIYYLNKGTFRKHVVGVILLGFNDSVGTQQRYEKKIGKNYFREAEDLVSAGQGLSLLSDIFGGIAGEAPLSAASYLNFYSPGSELGATMPLRLDGELCMYRQIHVPILAVIGDNEDGEYTIIPIKKAMQLMRQENPLTQAHQIKNCDHGFNGKEKELAGLIDHFLTQSVFPRKNHPRIYGA
jgi:pimeloyl-ACP methyl ester carboxylesterase